MSNPMDRITRFDLDALPADCPEGREYLAELNGLFAKIEELCEMQENNIDINLFPEIKRLVDRTAQINRMLNAMVEGINDE